MRPIVTDTPRFVVSVPMCCVGVGYNGEPCKKGGTNRDGVLRGGEPRVRPSNYGDAHRRHPTNTIKPVQEHDAA